MVVVHLKILLSKASFVLFSLLLNSVFVLTQTSLKCVVPGNIHTLPHGRDFFQDTPPLWKFYLSLMHFFKCFGLREPPQPREIPISSVGEYGYFLDVHKKFNFRYMYIMI